MAYTKYSLTPANNTAAPPDGAPEGMLPSAVNDTMRDMMAQIRDCGDGIRDGTYTMTAPKITGGTITGSTINNSAIGGTTAAAGAFTTLSATGVTTVQAGTVSAPAITTTGDTNTGIYFPAADTIAFTEGGAEAMRIDSSGRLGVGTTSPLALVQVGDGTNAIAMTGTIPILAVKGASFATGFIVRRDGFAEAGIKSGNTGEFGTWTSHDVTFNTNATERMRIDTSGNVGIGTSSPVNNGGYGGLTLNGTSGSIYSMMYNGTENLRLFAGNNEGSIQYASSGILTFVDGVSGGTERMRITSGGDLLVGTTSAYGKTTIDIGTNVFTDNENQSGLTVQGTASNTRPLILVRSTNSGQDTAFRVSANRSGTQDRWTIGCHIARNSDNLSINYGTTATSSGTEKFYFTSGGAAYNTTGTWGTISDARLKENIVDATPKLSDIEKLKVRNFNFIGDELKQIGFVAQEIEQVFPAIVETSELKDGTEQKTVKMTVLIPILVKAIQELNAKVVELEAKLNAK
jgi:hypothetical protein